MRANPQNRNTTDVGTAFSVIENDGCDQVSGLTAGSSQPFSLNIFIVQPQHFY